MRTRRTKEQREAYRAMNENLRLLNKETTEAQKALMPSKRAKAQRQRNAILAEAIERMRARGASDQSIRKALPGIDEYAKFYIKKEIAPT